MTSMLRWTRNGLLVGGGLLAAAGVIRSLLSGGSLFDYVNPIGVMTVVGLTVGALVGPLIGAILERRRGLK
jgi:hypothetical protein